MSDSAKAVKRNLLIISLLIMAFALPIVVARYMYFHPAKFTLTKNNNGILLQSPISLEPLFPAQTYGSGWKIFYAPKNCCDTTCKELAVNLNQMKNRFDNDESSVAIFMLQQGACEVTLGENVTPLLLNDQQNQGFSTALAAQLPPQDNTIEGHIYLVNPDNNLIMYYPETSNTLGLLKDLQRLQKGIDSE